MGGRHLVARRACGPEATGQVRRTTALRELRGAGDELGRPRRFLPNCCRFARTAATTEADCGGGDRLAPWHPALRLATPGASRPRAKVLSVFDAPFAASDVMRWRASSQAADGRSPSATRVSTSAPRS